MVRRDDDKAADEAGAASTAPARVPSTVHAVASQTAAMCSTLALYPCDLVKSRFMAQDGTAQRVHNGVRYTSLYQGITLVARREGVAALFRGAHVAVIGAGVSWGLYMLCFRTFQGAAWLALAATTPSGQGQPLPGLVAWAGGPMWVNLPCSTAAAMLSTTLVSPIWMIKSRMQLEESELKALNGAKATAAQPVRHYSGFVRGFRYIVVTDGVRALWRGLPAHLLGAATSSINFPLYEWARARLTAYERATADNGDGPEGHGDPHASRPFSLSHTVMATIFARGATAVVAHPASLIKIRLQDMRAREGAVQYVTLWGAIVTTAKREGPSGFFRGATIGLTQTALRSVLQMIIYEGLLSQYRAWRG
jgi:hypothetical protein